MTKQAKSDTRFTQSGFHIKQKVPFYRDRSKRNERKGLQAEIKRSSQLRTLLERVVENRT